MNPFKYDLNLSFNTYRQKLRDYDFKLRILEQGNVISVGDGIVWIKGLPTAAIDEILFLEDGVEPWFFT